MLRLSIWCEQEVVEECAEMSWGQFKPVLTEALVMHLQPIQVTLHRIVTFVHLVFQEELVILFASGTYMLSGIAGEICRGSGRSCIP